MGNDCILCLSLYALLVPSYPPPYPSSHQPLPLPVAPPLPPFSQPWVALSSRVIHTNPNVRTMLPVTVSVCEELLATDAADRSGRENQGEPYVWMRHGSSAWWRRLSDRKTGPSMHKVCRLNWRYSCVQRKSSSEKANCLFCFHLFILLF